MTPAEYANKIISEFSINSAPALTLDAIFKHYNIAVQTSEFNDTNYCGSLHRKGEQTVIIINTDIKNDGRINFTKSHELGHFYMKHNGNSFICNSQDLHLNHSLDKPKEVEANQFASTFLMPEKMIKPIVHTSPFNFDTIGFIRKHFAVSKLSAGLKILDYTYGDYALIASHKGIITHVKLSQNLNGKISLPKVKTALPEDSFAHGILTTSIQMNDYAEIESKVWLSSQHKTYSIFEHSRADKKSDACLTLLNFIKK